MKTKPIEHVRKLAGEIGCRRIGTPGNQAAAEYVRGVFERAGLSVEANSYTCPAWMVESTELMVGGQNFPAYANTFSPACDAAGALLAVGTLAELEAADIAGKMVLLTGDLGKAPFSPRTFMFVSDRDRCVIEKLEQGHPAGVLTANLTWGVRWRMLEDASLNVPSATVPMETALELVRRVGRLANLRVAAQRSLGTTANLIARLPGKGAGRIVICAHYDSKEDTPGAWDNASGAGVLLALAERLAETPRACVLEFVAFTGEEYWDSPETDAYLRAYGGTFGEIIATVNMDGIGGALVSHSLATFSGSAEFEARVEAARQRYPGVVRVDPWPASNHWLFASNGVPSVAISGVGPGNLYHSQHDTLDWISAEKLDEAAALVTDLICAMENCAPGWGRATQA